MEDNVFAAFSFSGAPRNGAAAGGGATSHSKRGNDKNGGRYSDDKASRRSRGSAASQAIAPSRQVRGKGTDEDAAEGSGVRDLGSDLWEGGENSPNAPGIQSSEPHDQTVAKIEKREATEEDPRALPKVMFAIQVKEEENQVRGENQDRAELKVKEENEVKKGIRVKEENQEPVELLSVVNRKRQSHWNAGKEEEICDEMEDFGCASGLRRRSAGADVPEVKKVTMKRQNTKLIRKGSKWGPAEVSPPPPNWEEAFQNIRTMRTGRDAPVDLLGPAQLVDPNADSETQKFHVLVAAMISSQTRDAVTAAAMKRLHALPGGLTVNRLAEEGVCPTEKMEELLKPVGFYRQKAKQLKSMAEILVKPPYCGSVPRTLDELMKLPGVGPKVGLLVLWVGFGLGEVGLIVDTNVRRICCRLGWAPEGSPAEQVRHELESWLPKDLWAEASFLLVGFGQQICKPIGPNCKECQLQNVCPSAFKCVKKLTIRKTSS